ncbi:MAG TPA: hypothetical protein EYG73_09765 [Arcobacter sp.]|nr:hypothetical protein [Arcobacter sp.]
MQSLLHSISSGTKNTAINDSLKELKNNASNANTANLFESLKNKNVQDVLKSLLNDLVSQNKSSKAILDTLKNETIFKEFKNFSSEVKTLIKILENTNVKAELVNKLKNSHVDIKNIDNNVLKQQLSKSGVFLESYLKNLSTSLNAETKTEIKQNIISDVKAMLLSISEELKPDSEAFKQNNKLLNQIEYYQLYSLSDNSNHSYLPFSWDDLEDGDINFKQNEEDNFTCQISLEFKYYGHIKINLIFDNPNKLAISFFIEQEILKEKIQNDLQSLRQNLKIAKIDLQSLYLFDYIKQEDKSKEIKAYSQYTSQYGLDIKV